jgi:hypothetical protein
LHTSHEALMFFIPLPFFVTQPVFYLPDCTLFRALLLIQPQLTLQTLRRRVGFLIFVIESVVVFLMREGLDYT